MNLSPAVPLRTAPDTEDQPDTEPVECTSHLRYLESEAIYVLRDAAAQFERLVLLFSGGNDSIVLLHLAQKAFWPGRIPFPLLHVDTGHNFPETIAFRDALAASTGAELLVRTVQSSIDSGRCREEPGPNPSRIALQTTTQLCALRVFKVDAAGAATGEGTRQGASLQPPRSIRPVKPEADFEPLRKRDPPKLYAWALAGEVRNLTGPQAPYGEPVRPEIWVDTQSQSVDRSVAMLVRRLKRKRILAVPTSASEGNGAR